MILNSDILNFFIKSTRWVQLVFNDNFSSVRVIFEKNRPSKSLRMTEHGKFH
jgi:hypothetical protein